MIAERMTESLSSQVCSILNALTPLNVDAVVNKITKLNMDEDVDKLQLLVDLVHDRAMLCPPECAQTTTTTTTTYGTLCRKLSKDLKECSSCNDHTTPGVTLNELLLKRCLCQFDQFIQGEVKSIMAERNTTHTGWKTEQVDDNREMKHQGNIRFLGQLYKEKALPEPNIHTLIQNFLKVNTPLGCKYPDQLQRHLECLCTFFMIVGKGVDHPKATRRIDQYFQQIDKIVAKRRVSAEVKVLLVGSN